MANWTRQTLPVRRGGSILILISMPVIMVVATVIGALAPGATAAAAAPSGHGGHASTSVPSANDTPSSSGSVGIRLLDIPANAVDNPTAHEYIVDHLKPGTTTHRRIEVSNTTTSTMRVTLYPDAATISAGSFLGAAGHATNELASWTTVSQDSLDVPAGGSARDTVTIAIPFGAAPAERYAVIWAEVASPQRGNISLINRAGIRLYVIVGGDNPPAAAFTVDTMTAQRDPAGRPVVQAQVHNTGGRALDMAGTLSLAAVTGTLSAGPYQAQLGTTLGPGQSEPVIVRLTDQVLDGPWNATLALHSGLLQQTHQAQITFPNIAGAAAPAPAHPVTANSPAPITAILGGALLIATMAALALLLAAHRRKVKQRQQVDTST
ncbi:MAG: hypothetical protein JWQ81_2646 [Amycolatopsis sp.]|jgi:hypothetical protein|nr:hypothetical protein [Amycolatopsis sp.]